MHEIRFATSASARNWLVGEGGAIRHGVQKLPCVTQDHIHKSLFYALLADKDLDAVA